MKKIYFDQLPEGVTVCINNLLIIGTGKEKK
jgi:hypothetical protein